MLAFMAAKLVTHSYVPRYALGFVVSAVLLLTALFGILTRGDPCYLALLLLCLFVPFAHPALALFRSPSARPEMLERGSREALERFPGLPIAFANVYAYLRIYFFGPAGVRSRMVLLFDSLTCQQSMLTWAFRNTIPRNSCGLMPNYCSLINSMAFGKISYGKARS